MVSLWHHVLSPQQVLLHSDEQLYAKPHRTSALRDTFCHVSNVLLYFAQILFSTKGIQLPSL